MFFEKRIATPEFHTDWKFSILIPTWNNLPYLQLLIDSLRKNSAYSHQIILFINDGSDGTLDWVRSQTDIFYLHAPQNMGICYALNAARSLVRTDYLAYFNDDMVVCPGWDAAIWREILAAKTHKFFFSATMIEPLDTGNPCVVVQNFGTEPANFQAPAMLENYNKIPKKDWYGATWPPNIVALSTWDLVGGYSIEFSPGMYSDPDFSMKLWQAGVRLFKGIGDARVYHFGMKSTKRLGKSRGSQLFFKKWGISSSIFTQKILRRGEAYQGLLKEPTFTFFEKLKLKMQSWLY